MTVPNLSNTRLFIEALKGLGVSLAFYFGVKLLGLNWWQIGAFAWITSVLWVYLKGTLTFKKALKSFAVIYGFIAVYKVCEPYGWKGYILATVVFLIWFFYSRWDSYLQAKHMVESQIFGEPIKNFKARGERVPKFRLKL